MKDLKETSAAAKAEGRSYGEYVSDRAPQVEVNVPPGLLSQKEKAALDAALPAEPKKPGEIEKTCPVCGKAFLVGPTQYRKVYCSDACKDEARKKAGKPEKPKPAKPAPEEAPREPEPVRSEPEKRPITFGDILDLLERDSTEVELRMGEDTISGSAESRLWRPLESMAVASIAAVDDGLTVWLEDKP